MGDQGTGNGSPARKAKGHGDEQAAGLLKLTAGAVAGLGVATLILPQIAAVSNPTAWGTLAVTVIGACAAGLARALGQSGKGPIAHHRERRDKRAEKRAQSERIEASAKPDAAAVKARPSRKQPATANHVTGSGAQSAPVGSAPEHTDWFGSMGRTRPGLWLLALAVAAAAYGVIYWKQSHWVRKPQSVPNQIQAELGKLLDGGANHIVVNKRVRLHPSQEPSWVVVTQHSPNSEAFGDETVVQSRQRLIAADRDKEGATNRPITVSKPLSDEIRIYDVDDGWLKLKLAYRPKGYGLTAREWATPAGAPLAFDYNHNGFPEILASYSRPNASRQELPFIIDWNGSRYTIRSIEDNRPSFAAVQLPAAMRSRARNWYETRVSLQNAESRLTSTGNLRGYQVSALAFSRSPSVRILTGYFDRPPNIHDKQWLIVRADQLVFSSLRLRLCRFGYPFCPGPATARCVPVYPDSTADSTLLDDWTRIRNDWDWQPGDSPNTSPAPAAYHAAHTPPHACVAE